jgi:putative FmdB family regulatory protein
MPLYEYQCQECGEKMEVIQRFDDEPYTICASCGGGLKKLFSAPAIQFKGSGFYLTDYGKGGSSATKTPAQSDSKDSSKPSSTTETKSGGTTSGGGSDSSSS